MSNDLLKELRSVLKEELEPIHNQLDKIEQDLKGHAKHFDDIEIDLKGHAKRFDGIEIDLKGHTKSLDAMEKDIKDIKTGQEVFQKNIIKGLGDNFEKIAEHFDNKTEALNKRVYAVETDIQRLIKQ